MNRRVLSIVTLVFVAAAAGCKRRARGGREGSVPAIPTKESQAALTPAEALSILREATPASSAGQSKLTQSPREGGRDGLRSVPVRRDPQLPGLASVGRAHLRSGNRRRVQRARRGKRPGRRHPRQSRVCLQSIGRQADPGPRPLELRRRQGSDRRRPARPSHGPPGADQAGDRRGAGWRAKPGLQEPRLRSEGRGRERPSRDGADPRAEPDPAGDARPEIDRPRRRDVRPLDWPGAVFP